MLLMINSERRLGGVMERDEREEQLVRYALNDMWKNICPYKSYRETNINELIPSVYSAIDEWEYGEKGLYVFGPTRFCKTRSVYMLLRKLLYTTFAELRQSAKGGYVQPIIALNPRNFAHGCMSRFSDNSIYSWIEKLCKVPILFLDDIGKEKSTPRVVVELFNIVEERTSRALPTIITTNYTRAMLIHKSKLGQDPGEQILCRLSENCVQILISGEKSCPKIKTLNG